MYDHIFYVLIISFRIILSAAFVSVFSCLDLMVHWYFWYVWFFLSVTVILTHRTYRVDAKKAWYMYINNNNSQFWNREESKLYMMSFVTAKWRQWCIRQCNIVFTLERCLNTCNLCDTVQLLAEICQCNGGKLEVAEGFKCVFVVYCVLESK